MPLLRPQQQCARSRNRCSIRVLEVRQFIEFGVRREVRPKPAKEQVREVAGKPFAARLAPASLHSGTNRRTPASLGTMLRLSCARGPVRELRRCAFGLFPYLPLAPTPLPVPLERPLPPSTAPRRLLVRARRDQVETSRQAPPDGSSARAPAGVDPPSLGEIGPAPPRCLGRGPRAREYDHLEDPA